MFREWESVWESNKEILSHTLPLSISISPFLILSPSLSFFLRDARATEVNDDRNR